MNPNHPRQPHFQQGELAQCLCELEIFNPIYIGTLDKVIDQNTKALRKKFFSYVVEKAEEEINISTKG